MEHCFEDWHTTQAAVDLRVGGSFSSRMEAKDGSMGFDFAGTYTRIIDHDLIESTFGDRVLVVEFITGQDGVTVRETFDAERRIPLSSSATAGKRFWTTSKSMLSPINEPDRISSEPTMVASSTCRRCCSNQRRHDDKYCDT